MTFQYRKLLFLWILIVILFNGMSVTLAQQSGPCAGFSSMLKIGQQGHVTPGQPNNIRQNAGTNQAKVGQIPGNEIFMVIGGPACADNVTWWQVNYKGLIGWTGEGTGSQHWLDTNVSASTLPRTPVNGLVGTTAQTLNELTGCGGGVPFGRKGVNGGDPEVLGNGASVSYSVGDDPYFSHDPDICINAADAGTAYAVSPQGATVAPRIENDNINPDIRKILLPLWAYSQPGTWQLGISSFTIYVDVQPATQPVFVQSKQGDTLIGGFQPNEQVVIVTAPGTREFFSVTFGDVSGTLVTMDANGFYVGAISTDQNLVAAIGSSGAMAVGPRFVGVAANGDRDIVRNILFDAFFGSTFVPTVVPPADAPTPPPAGAWSGPMQVGTGWQSFINVFLGGGSSIYGILGDGSLYWYYHYGSGDGSPNWAGYVDVTNGLNWAVPLTAFGTSNGVLYAVSPEGDLWWYRHDGYGDGSNNWVGPATVGFGGWNQFREVFAGDEGVIYALTWDGSLLWYRHPSYYDGTADMIGGNEVGVGWQDFADVFPGHGGVIYAITSDGTLLRYMHYGAGDGSFSWSDPQTIGSGWLGFLRVFAGEGNVIYAIQQDGTLLWYRYDG